MEEIKTRYGQFLVPDVGDLIGDTLRRTGEWAETELSFLCKLVSKGDVVLDIGACFGTHARAFSDAVGDIGKVYAFEASEDNHKILKRNAELASHQNIKVVLGAVSDVPGEAVAIAVDERNRGGSFLTARNDLSGSAVTTITIDDLSIPNVSLIKIDVEGAEVSVLLGSISTLRNCRPIVFCEVNTIDFAQKLLSFWTLERYEVFGVRSDAFNPNSFYQPTDNPFGIGSECGLLFVPSDRANLVPKNHNGVEINKISSVDDVASLMLGQEQYLYSQYSARCGSHSLRNLLFERDELVSSNRCSQEVIVDLRRMLSDSDEKKRQAVDQIKQLYETMQFLTNFSSKSGFASIVRRVLFRLAWFGNVPNLKKVRTDSDRTLKNILKTLEGD